MVFFDIDTQSDFMVQTGALYVPDAEAIKANLERLLRAASAYGISTISSRCAHEAGDAEFDIFPPHCLDGTPGAARVFADLPSLPRIEIAVDAPADPAAQLARSTHYIVKKKVFDLFSNAWLDGLRRGGAFKDEVCLVFGVATDYCVRACALGLAGSAKQTLLVTDAIRGVAADTTTTTLAEMQAAGIEFITTDDVLRSLEKSGEV